MTKSGLEPRRSGPLEAALLSMFISGAAAPTSKKIAEIVPTKAG